MRHKSRPGSVLVWKSGRIDDDIRISALDAFYWKDGRRSRYIGKVLEWYRGEDAGDLKRIELVEKCTCFNALERKIWKINLKILIDEKSWKTWKRNQNIVMDAELVQNIVMDEELVQNVATGEKFVKNFVMYAKIDPKIVMDLSIFKIGVWNILLLGNRKLLEESIKEDELQLLLIGILSRDAFLVIQSVKELTLLREGLHEMIQYYRRQHFAASNDLREHPIGHSSLGESTTMKFTNIQMEYSEMRFESSVFMWETTGAFLNSWRIKIATLKSTGRKSVRTRMDPDMHTMLLDTKLLTATLLNMCRPVLFETILKALREQSEGDDQRKTAGEIIASVPETSLDWHPILKERGGFWGMTAMDIFLKIWC